MAASLQPSFSIFSWNFGHAAVIGEGPTAAKMSVNVGFNDAPPTRNPSMSGLVINSAQFSGVTLPPYWIRMLSATSADTADFKYARIAACVSCAWSGVATLPVPIAQTGSYAITTLDQSLTFVVMADNWRLFTSSVLPASRSSKVSPMQNTTFKPASWHFAIFSAVSSSVSPYFVRRSEWPINVHERPRSTMASAVHSPVKAPAPVLLTF
mmetsp:Transcript_75098/g.218012  ORF Transcript_75098/g.218012 Transcript_75098/m.218012 type:complete len:210 (+) Transcript_75098:163-792(+)